MKFSWVQKLCLTGSSNSITLRKSNSKLEENKLLADVISLTVLIFVFICVIIHDSLQKECNSKPLKFPLGNVK